MNALALKGTQKVIKISDKVQRRLLSASCLYLGLPYIIYYIGNLKVFFAVLFSLSIIFWFGYSIHTAKQIVFAEEQISRKSLMMISLAILFLLLACGTGNILGKQAGDWNRTNAILSDMINRPWPVTYFYEETQSYMYLNYYLAYLMPAAAVGRLLGNVAAANAVLGLWIALGVFLGIFWMLKALHYFHFRLTAAFCLWGGLDWIGNMILSPKTAFAFEEGLDHWADIDKGVQTHIANYHMMATAFRWSIQHYIPVIIILFLMLVLIKEAKDNRLLMGLLLSMCFWSPMALLGFLPFAFTFFVMERKRFRTFFGAGTWASLFGFAVPMAFYYLSLAAAPSDEGRLVIHGIGWMRRYGWVLLLFILLEYGAAAFLTVKSESLKEPLDRLFFTAAVVSLTLILFVDYGLCHDLSMRFSIVPLLLLFYYMMKALGEGKGIFRQCIPLYLALAAVSCMIEYSWCAAGVLYNPYFCTQALLPNNTIDGWELEYQYIGRADSFYHKICTRPVNENELEEVFRKGEVLLTEPLVKVIYTKNQLYFFLKEDSGPVTVSVLSREKQLIEQYMLDYGEGIVFSEDGEKVRVVKKSLSDFNAGYIGIEDSTGTVLADLKTAGSKRSYGIYDYSDAGWRRGLSRNDNILLLLNEDITAANLEGKDVLVESGGKTWKITVTQMLENDGFVWCRFEGTVEKLSGAAIIRTKKEGVE